MEHLPVANMESSDLRNHFDGKVKIQGPKLEREVLCDFAVLKPDTESSALKLDYLWILAKNHADLLTHRLIVEMLR